MDNLPDLFSLKRHLECVYSSDLLLDLCKSRGWSFVSFDIDLLIDLVNDAIDNLVVDLSGDRDNLKND